MIVHTIWLYNTVSAENQPQSKSEMLIADELRGILGLITPCHGELARYTQQQQEEEGRAGGAHHR